MNKFSFLTKKKSKTKPKPGNMFFIRPNDAFRVISVTCCQTGGRLFSPSRVWVNGRETTGYVIRPTKPHMWHESRQRHLSCQVLSTTCKSCGCTSCLVHIHNSNVIKGEIFVRGNLSSSSLTKPVPEWCTAHICWVVNTVFTLDAVCGAALAIHKSGVKYPLPAEGGGGLHPVYS